MISQLREIRPRSNQPERRWFHSLDCDLYLWEDLIGVSCFELCYNLRGREQSLRWQRGGRIVTAAVDTGEQNPLFNASPILAHPCRIDFLTFSRAFRLASQQIPLSLRHLVLRVLSDALLRRSH